METISIYKDKLTKEKVRVRRADNTDYFLEVAGKWVPIKYCQLRKSHSFYSREKINYEFNQQRKPPFPGRRRRNHERNERPELVKS